MNKLCLAVDAWAVVGLGLDEPDSQDMAGDQKKVKPDSLLPLSVITGLIVMPCHAFQTSLWLDSGNRWK